MFLGGEEMSKSCKGLALELVKCLSESDCIKIENRPYKECAGEKSPSIPSECVDMRARIRGNKVLPDYGDMYDENIID
ncbi:hypothetical protein POTOM_039059 [Populus tomentosa]|uniref:Uncharacterized protein n=1 Tax=Populus tomentosa TaxID=118781 RepID=A0A8X7YYC6_POPTO|nr:hypothetical protein POTOM_039059 [Populus tomentosa]